ncbi:hypothetical protein [Helicobacter aurati]|uniref:hypothetical protein n=1 Tax=Helicobacter aurati TaxID=137778 RepID=UPI0011C080DA|nr:hypothetical protein [Helicobacter aurati]
MQVQNDRDASQAFSMTENKKTTIINPCHSESDKPEESYLMDFYRDSSVSMKLQNDRDTSHSFSMTGIEILKRYLSLRELCKYGQELRSCSR